MDAYAILGQPLEANGKILDGNKWKKRYLILRSAVDGSMTLCIFKTAKCSRKSHAKNSILISDGFFGLESGFTLDDEKYTLAIIRQGAVTVLAFGDQTISNIWEWSIRNAFGPGHQFSSYALEAPSDLFDVSNSYVRLHLRNGRFCLVSGSPPQLLADFRFPEIRRFGAFENKFCIEAGSRSGAWAGVYVFRTGHCERMATAFRLASCDRLHEYLTTCTNCSFTSTTGQQLIEVESTVLAPSGSTDTRSLVYASLDGPNGPPVNSTKAPCPATGDDGKNQKDSVEYAKIDRVATQAARKVSKSRKEWFRVSGRWSTVQLIRRDSLSVANNRKNQPRKSFDIFSLFRNHAPFYTRL